jgi:hypothetical protein
MGVMKPQGIPTPAPAAASKSPRHFGGRIADLAAEGMTLRSGSAEGRIEAMGLALPVLQRARDYGSGGVVLVSPPIGIKKTALSSEVCGRAPTMSLRAAAP